MRAGPQDQTQCNIPHHPQNMLLWNMNSCNQSFFNQNALIVAKALIGKRIVYQEHEGIILETEAYRGSDDPASHAYRGITPRSKIMFQEPGRLYIYMIYGMYHCMNIVCEPAGFPAAVLIRSIKTPEKLLDGPGKICKSFCLSCEQNGLPVYENASLQISAGWVIPSSDIQQTSRIGISKGHEKKWRYVYKGVKQDVF